MSYSFTTIQQPHRWLRVGETQAQREVSLGLSCQWLPSMHEAPSGFDSSWCIICSWSHKHLRNGGKRLGNISSSSAAYWSEAGLSWLNEALSKKVGRGDWAGGLQLSATIVKSSYLAYARSWVWSPALDPGTKTLQKIKTKRERKGKEEMGARGRRQKGWKLKNSLSESPLCLRVLRAERGLLLHKALLLAPNRRWLGVAGEELKFPQSSLQ